jgi:integrase
MKVREASTMAREGTIFKKCDLANHKPQSNARCASGNCQHTCANTDKCSHAWTLRYFANGRQAEKSFRDEIRNGRTAYGSGRRLAQDFQLQLTVDKRSGDITFTHGKSGREDFCTAVEAYISRLSAGESTKAQYLANYRAHVRAAFSDRSMGQVASERDAALDLLTVEMADMSLSVRTITRLLIVGTLDEAVRAGRLSKHRLSGIELADNGPKNHSDFVFPSYAQVRFVAEGGTNSGTGRKIDGAGIAVWLMRGCGLRLEEALAVEKSDFRDNGTYLRVMWQASRDGHKRMPLKARKRGEFRDVPVPSWLWDMIRDMPDGPLMPGSGNRTYERGGTVYARFVRAAQAAGIAEGFHPHSLRHLFASVMLGQGIQITDLAKWLGHKNINITYATYGHLLPSAAAQAKSALDAEYAEWKTVLQSLSRKEPSGF